MTPDELAEHLRLQADLVVALHYKAGLVEQLGYVRDYLTDLIADLTTPVPADASVACRNGEHTTVAELPGRCALCGSQVADGEHPDQHPTG